MPTLAIIRHGPTEWTTARRLQGRSDIGLSIAGREAVRQWQLPSDVLDMGWVSSPLRRCLETAAILRLTHPGPGPLRIESRLVEMSFGRWEGRTLRQLRLTGGRAMAEREDRGLDFRAPGGESPRDVQDRLHPWLEEIAGEDRDVFAVAHKGVIRALYALASGWDMRRKPQQRLISDALHRFAVDGAGIRIVALNLPLHSATLAAGDRA
jgi:probable phosphoglycerate mutase